MKEQKHLSFEVRKLSNVIKRMIDNSISQHSLDVPTGIQSWVLRYINKNNDKDIFQGNIEKHFSIRRSTATTMLQTMEKKGLITREPVEHDARLKKICLTKKAIDINKTITLEIIRINEILTKDLTEKQLDAFYSTIDKIHSNINEHCDY